MYIRNISKKNSILNKLRFGLVKALAVLVAMGVMLSCSDITPDNTPDFFTITYPNMDSAASSDSSTPTIVSGKDCDLLGLTNTERAMFQIAAKTTGGNPKLPIIDYMAGVVKHYGDAAPGAYKVTVTVDGMPSCSGDAIVYNTITPANLAELQGHLFGGSSGVAHHGNTGDYNYIITSKITDMGELFSGKTAFNGDISGWNTENVTNMNSMFFSAAVFNQPIGGWDTSQVKSMRGVFVNTSHFNQPIGGWNTAQVKNMGFMFQGAQVFNQPIGGWKTANVTNMDNMFANAFRFNQPISGWNTSQVQNMSRMFNTAQKFDQDLSGWIVDKVTKYDNVFTESAMENLTDKHPKWKP